MEFQKYPRIGNDNDFSLINAYFSYLPFTHKISMLYNDRCDGVISANVYKELASPFELKLKQIVQKHNPQISNVIFSDFNLDTEYRKFLISTLSKTPYFTGVFSDWAYTFMPKWKIDKLNEIQQKIGVKEIKLNENNINEYIIFDWKQRKNLGRFGIIFKKSKKYNTIIRIHFKTFV